MSRQLLTGWVHQYGTTELQQCGNMLEIFPDVERFRSMYILALKDFSFLLLQL